MAYPAPLLFSYDFKNNSHSKQLPISVVSSPLSTTKWRRRRRIRLMSEPRSKEDMEVKLPTMSDIRSLANAAGVKVQLKSRGPLFTVMGTSLLTGEEIGRANGFITVWFGRKGKILHLESIRMTRQAFRMQKSIFGTGLLLGAVAIRHGYDCNCKTAELLAINDSDLYHSKLVRFYTRMGFKAVYEVTGSSLADIIHMLAWGGIGTRMDAGIEELLTKWSRKFRPQISSR